MMFGPRITTVFRSRWKALFWAAGILLTAYCSVPAAQDAGSGTPREGLDKAETPAKMHSDHANPWAKDTPTSP